MPPLKSATISNVQSATRTPHELMVDTSKEILTCSSNWDFPRGVTTKMVSGMLRAIRERTKDSSEPLEGRVVSPVYTSIT